MADWGGGMSASCMLQPSCLLTIYYSVYEYFLLNCFFVPRCIFSVWLMVIVVSVSEMCRS